MSHQVFAWNRRVTYADCTVGNHVYYSRYLDFMEEARGEFFRALGIPMARLCEEGFIFPVLEARMKYWAAARYDDEIVIRVWFTALSRLKMEFSSEVLRKDGVLLVSGKTLHVCTDTQDKPRRMEPGLMALLSPYLEAAKPATAEESK